MRSGSLAVHFQGVFALALALQVVTGDRLRRGLAMLPGPSGCLRGMLEPDQ